MDIKSTSYYFSNPDALAELPDQKLDELISTYPFWHKPYLLKVAKQKIANTINKESIEQAAIHCPDRFKLQSIVQGVVKNSFGVYDLSEFEEPISEQSLEDVEIMSTESSLEVVTNKIVESKTQISFLHEAEKKEPHILAENEPLIISSFPASLSLGKKKERIETKPIIIFETDETVQTKSDIKVEERIPQQVNMEHKEKIVTAEMIELSPFANWIKSLQEKPSTTEAELPKIISKSKEFLDETPKKTKKKKKGKKKKKKEKEAKLSKKAKKSPDKPYDPENSLFIQHEIISESLANLYAKQGLKQKAIEMYRALSLRFPEKSNFFAVKIQKLEQK